MCGLYGFQFLVHIINYLISVKYDGDDDNDTSGNLNNIKQNGGNPNGSIVLNMIYNVIN